ncbi:S41 family peptidase [Acinetobacter rathckeae]|uniref:S41 family peptidase n=1 Tax=Acinetobacter rathckeae TaxID=2605272 RepID=UPI0018A32A5A|nr:S41 family peptidase [Acinetobacter rathckeae]MBF7688329.1 S41 family peptidase [Acinetobacter rathckeae]MBF7695152.1 S41 family peptidase [Acinetobacter rathckeae]
MIAPHKILILWLGLISCVGNVASAADTQFSAAPSDFDKNTASSQEIPIESIQSFVQIYALIKDNYVDEKADDQLFDQAIKGLVGGLDRYSRYLSPEDYKKLLQYTDGDLASIDFELILDKSKQQWFIRGLKDTSDSAKLGLHNGQSIYKIDGVELKDLTVEQVKNLVYGAIGTAINVQTTPTSPITIIIRNRKIEAEVSSTLLKNQVLVIKVPVFQQETASEIKNTLDRYARKHVKTVLIDLRNNPGGLLSSAVETADLFLTNGMIVKTVSRSEGSQTFQALPNKEFNDLKIGILINQRSASAAEVFTAALKDHSRAWVMGEKSYGKGVVQKLFPLPNGAAVQMTVSHYITPNGSMIDGKGIIPNQVITPVSDEKDATYLDTVSEALLLQ